LKNLDSVFAAYLIGWAVFFVFSLTVAKRAASLKEELSRLKERLNESAPKGK
jgi:CcmD family protein